MKSAGAKFLILCLTILSLCVFAQTPYDVVKKDYVPAKKLVHDFGKIFSPADRAALENKLVAYNDSTSTQIVVVTFKNLDGYPIELLGNEIGENWGVGQEGKHNGIVIVLSDEDRKVTIRGGYGIQAKMPPTVEKLIIDREMIPEFKAGNYYRGIDNGINAIQLQLAGQYQAMPKKDDGLDGEAILTIIIIVLLFVLFLSVSKNSGGNNGGGGYKNRDIFKDIIITNTGSRSWGSGRSSWGGGSSGGGFGGFGGGSFGGGGASGSW